MSKIWCLVILLLVCILATASAGNRRWKRRGHRGHRYDSRPSVGHYLRNYFDNDQRRNQFGEDNFFPDEDPSETRNPATWDPFGSSGSQLHSDLLAMLSNHWMPHKPDYYRSWWQGPNICEKKTEETVNQTAAEDNFVFHFSAKTISCDNSESAYKCIIEENVRGQLYKTTLVYECCHGYTRKKGDFGCPQKLEMKNLVETARQLGLTEFLQTAEMLKLTDELRLGNYTIFAPVNGAFNLDGDFIINPGNTRLLKDSPIDFEVSEPALERTLEMIQSTVLGHMLAGKHRSSSLTDEQVMKTGHPESSTIRINYFSRPAKLMTANCVPVVSRDNMATNGVIHTVERALTPVTENLLDLVRQREDLTMLKTVLAAAAYVPKLEEEGKFTLLAPTNSAFNKMNPRLREKLLNGDKKCIERVLLNHILPHVICSTPFQDKTHTMNLLNNRVNVIRNKDGKLFANDAQLIEKDIMGLNGVMHIIDDVLIPQEALGLVDVLEEKGFTELISLVKAAGLVETLDSAKNITLFAPTNDAIKSLPLALKSKLGADKDLLKKVLTYHVSPAIVNTEHFRDEKLISTLEGRQVRLNRYTSNPFFDGVRTAQCAVIEGKSTKTCNGQFNALSQVMIPPIGTVVDVLAADKRFSTLVTLVKKANLVHALQDGGPFTVFAPNNKAFERLSRRTRENLVRNPKILADLLKSHVYKRNVCCAGILRMSWFSRPNIQTLSGTLRRLTKNRFGEPSISHVPIIKCDRTASNGNILEIEQVLPNTPQGRRWNWLLNANRRRYRQ